MNENYTGAPEDGQPELTQKELKTQRRRERARRLQNFLQDENVQQLGRILSAGAVQIGGQIAYEKMFGHYERPDYSVTPGLRCYERIAERLPREEFTFPSDGLDCAGYFYPSEHAKGLIAFAHGLHAGADDYLAVFEFFVRNGYSVVAFDGKGTYNSPGNSTVGLSEALVELNHLLDAIRLDPQLSALPLYTVGHSCGGFAASAVLALHPEIQGCMTMAAMNDANTMIVGKGFIYSSILGIPETTMTNEFLAEKQKALFGAYTKLDGVSAVNGSSCPVLIAHGLKDLVVEYGSPISLISHAKEIREENVSYYTGHGLIGGHDTIWRSPEALEYQESVKRELELLKKKKGRSFSREDEVSFLSGVDHARYSAINEELFEKALEIFEGRTPSGLLTTSK